MKGNEYETLGGASGVALLYSRILYELSGRHLLGNTEGPTRHSTLAHRTPLGFAASCEAAGVGTMSAEELQSVVAFS